MGAMHASLAEVGHLLDRFQALVAEGFTPSSASGTESGDPRERFRIELSELCRLSGVDASQAEAISHEIVEQLPHFQAMLQEDVSAALDQDPAARSREEVEACYPGFRAIVAHRLAHALFLAEVPLLPRMISETAHRDTGIDIHPGAHIGRRFFIDHGTGVVIGETTVLGDAVTLYQGVTIGARNLPRDPDGKVLRGGKRHPTVGNRVVIYANATLLGGDTIIGDDCVIGAGVWLTESLPAGTVVVQDAPRQLQRTRRDDSPSVTTPPTP